MLKLLILFFKFATTILQIARDLCYGISQLLEDWDTYRENRS